MLRKYTFRLAREDVMVSSKESLFKFVSFKDFDFVPEPGMLYVIARAISSRVNANYDEWPADELRKSYTTFIGKPVFVDHHNHDPRRARGVVIDAKLHESKLASGDEDVWISLLIEVDAQAFPKLAEAIMRGDVDAVSMGANVEATECSACGNIARDPSEYCEHIARMKGRFVTVEKDGKTQEVLVYERCINPSFFEISFVFEPADESAFVVDKMLVPTGKSSRRLVGHLRYDGESVPSYRRRRHSLVKAAAVGSAEKVLALPTMDEFKTICPECGAEFDGVVCRRCGYEEPPEGLKDPDTDAVKDEDGKEKKDEKEGGRMSRYEQVVGRSSVRRPNDDEKERLRRELKRRIARRRMLARRKQADGRRSIRPRILSGEDRRERQPIDAATRRRLLTEARRQRLAALRRRRLAALRRRRLIEARRRATSSQGRSLRRRAYDVQEPAFEVGPYGAPERRRRPPLEESPFKTKNEARPDAVDDVQNLDQVVIEADKKARRFARLALAYKRRAERLRRLSESQTDVTNLDEVPSVMQTGPNARLDVEAPTAQGDQTALADTPSDVNDGSEAGPVPPSSDDENPGAQVGPYQPQEQVNPAAVTSAATKRILRITSLVEDRIDLGLTPKEMKFAEIARFEKMDDATLEGVIKATEEFKAVQAKRASVRRVKMAQASARVPDFGTGPRLASSQGGEDEKVEDYLVFLS